MKDRACWRKYVWRLAVWNLAGAVRFLRSLRADRFERTQEEGKNNHRRLCNGFSIDIS